ncbi:hypothetical protein K469DRAFT_749842 [Zopfia rhizophila CBS 207.26]|uniref:Extracellular membrane protein CFEM domain-containing protein n=1 Tax=Zopfia rhizophila CBS 207.26 TaxID=1314779 RepID=A0A6A6E2S2_9PEZI|nr:hypothetical protein K469DRAFT_749842 [Zopfia rhizophila CBS 207.26]
MRAFVPLISLATFALVNAQATTGPCQTGPGECSYVRDATTCFASIGMGRGNNQAATNVYRCVDSSDSENAKKQTYGEMEAGAHPFATSPILQLHTMSQEENIQAW